MACAHHLCAGGVAAQDSATKDLPQTQRFFKIEGTQELAMVSRI